MMQRAACAISLSIILLSLPACSRQRAAQTTPADAAHLQAAREHIRESRQTLAPLPDIPPPAIPDSRAISPASSQPIDEDAIARIRNEGLNHSQAMQTLSYLTDVIGPRLTGSPNLKRANDWTRDRLSSWGLANAHLEPWLFGRGWSLQRFSAQIIEPQAIPLIAFPKAWSPGLSEPLSARVVNIDPKSEADLAKYKGQLNSAIVLIGGTREIQAHFEPLALRLSDSLLLELSNSDATERSPAGLARAMNAADRRSMLGSLAIGRRSNATTSPSTTAASTKSAATTKSAKPLSQSRVLTFLASEGAKLAITGSAQGDGGTLFVSAAAIPSKDDAPTTHPTTDPTTFPSTAPTPTPHYWSVDAPPIFPQVVLAAEHFNRLVRMLDQGEQLKMAVDFQARYHTEDIMAYNTIAEIPGTDLKDQIVMLGAHLDSWHSGTGATDNGVGCAAVMEAVRILKTLNLHPRRTIRIALWTGEEQDLLGSKAYVAKHFGSYPQSTADSSSTRPSTSTSGPTTRPSTLAATRSAASKPARILTRQNEYDKLSVYFNLDHGTGKIRGVHLQGNEAARPIFRRWIAPFADLDAQTISLSNTTGTDHVTFDAVGLPAFQFIQDPIEYWSRTHHANADVFDRIQAEDLRQAAVIIATLVYDAAIAEEKMPRKSLGN